LIRVGSQSDVPIGQAVAVQPRWSVGQFSFISLSTLISC